MVTAKVSDVEGVAMVKVAVFAVSCVDSKRTLLLEELPQV